MEERIIKTIGLAFNQDLSALSINDCVPGNIEGWDSMGFLNLLVLLEEEFDVSFDFDDITEMSSGGDSLLNTIKKVTNL